MRIPIILAIVAGAIVALGSGAALAAASEDKPMKQIKGKAAIWPYLQAAEQASKIDGLATFGLAAAKRESGLSSTAANRSDSEAAAACKAWRRNRAKAFAGSPYDDEEHFCFGSGGWFGLLPGNALAVAPFTMMDPLVAIFDPATTTAAWTAFVSRVVRKHLPRLPVEHRNWLSVRRAMASLATMYDYREEHERSRAVKERLEKDLRAVGVDPAFMFTRATASGYPGNQAVLDATKRAASEGARSA